MTQACVPILASAMHEVLRQRCATLRLYLWHFDAEGRMIDAPPMNTPVGTLLRAPYFTNLIHQVSAKWSSSTDSGARELFPGCWCIVLEEMERRRRRGLMIAVAFEARALDAEEFAAACQSASLDRLATAQAMAKGSLFSADCIATLSVALRWSLEDLNESGRHHEALTSSGRQLTELYEEISLLYKLGRSMNELEQPTKFVRMACHELQQTMPYTWIAARFRNDQDLCRAMAGKTIIAGAVPDEKQFAAQADGLIVAHGASGPRVLDSAAAPLLARENGQVVFVPISRNGEVIGAFLAGNKTGPDPTVTNMDIKLVEAAAGSVGTLLDNAFLYDDQQILFLGVVEALTASIDAKDPYTCGHSERVAHLAALLAYEHGLEDEQIERIRIAGLVHDVGKIGVPEVVLCKAGKLTDEEFGQIKLHPEIGYDILKDIPLLSDVLPGVLHHHERYDGRGYPHRLAGEKIPLMARIIGLCDSFDAMSSNRTYRAALPREKVLDEIRNNAGTQFDPALAETFPRVDLRRYDELVAQHARMSAEGGLRVRRKPGGGTIS
ncbi:MAG TPA: HD-GYP domain-containing protein [Phycisphaerales bacterium]|nr:HD-GYP domain-containing protein [Phycisphaerales bacterium]